MQQIGKYLWIIFSYLLLINITDLMSKKVEFVLKEEEPIGTYVGNLLEHVEKSYGNLKFIKFDEKSKAAASLFSVELQTGVVRVTARIDREALCTSTSHSSTQSKWPSNASCVVEFIVNCLTTFSTYSGSESLNTKLVMVFDIVIIVQDINDNSCTFLPSAKQVIRIPEDSDWSTLKIPLHHPHDSDDPYMGNSVNPTSIRYVPAQGFTLENTKLNAINEFEFTRTFRIHVSGYQSHKHNKESVNRHETSNTHSIFLLFLRQLDYETASNFTFDVIASDALGQENIEHVCRLNVIVLIEDINDNSPRFETSLYQKDVSEITSPGSIVLQVKATDVDSGQNGRVFYRILSATDYSLRIFQLNQVSGELKLVGSPNHRVQSVHEFDVIAENEADLINETKINKQAKRDITHVKIRILDVNDHAPVVKIYSPVGSSVLEILEESQAGQDVAIVEAHDDDSEMNAMVNCSLRSQSVDLAIRLIQIDDSQDEFRKRYKLTLQNTLDREISSELKFTVRCQDKGEPRMTTDANGIIRILDINDNNPTFEKNIYHVKVTEDTNPERNKNGFEIMKLLAIDQDEGENSEIEYSLDTDPKYNYSHWFKIDSASGRLFSSGAIDRELADRITLTVWAKDKGTPPRSGSTVVHVEISDYNDNAPTFSQPSYMFQLRENCPIGQLFGVIYVSDLDLHENSELHVHMEDVTYPSLSMNLKSLNLPLLGKFSNDTTAKFRIVSFPLETLQFSKRTAYEVQLYTASELDREMYIIPKHFQENNGILSHEVRNRSSQIEAHISIRLRAEDRGNPKLTNVVNVRIVIQDENDHSPEFVFPEPLDANLTRVSVSFKESLDTPISKLIAFDPDAKENGTVRYYISEQSSGEDYFTVEEETGIIRLNRKLASHNIGEHHLEVGARDSGYPSRKSSARLIIVVDESTPKNLFRRNSNSWGFASDTNDHLFNLYILITVVVASCVISALLLSFICFLLRKSKSDALHPDRGNNGHIATKAKGLKSKEFDFSPPMATYFSEMPVIDEPRTSFLAYTMQPYNTMYTDVCKMDFIGPNGNASQLQSPLVHRMKDGCSMPRHFDRPSIENPQWMEVMLTPYPEDQILMESRCMNEEATTSPRHIRSKISENLGPLNSTYVTGVDYNKLYNERVFGTHSQSFTPGGPWCSAGNAESNSARSTTDCDSGHGDSLEVVPCVSLAYIARMPTKL